MLCERDIKLSERDIKMLGRDIKLSERDIKMLGRDIKLSEQVNYVVRTRYYFVRTRN